MTVVTKTALSTNRFHAADLQGHRPADVTLFEGATTLTSARPAVGDQHELTLGEFDAILEPGSKIYWLYMRPAGRPIMTLGLLRDAVTALEHLGHLFEASPEAPPARYAVMASSMPGIFNLGGDLRYFVTLIRGQNRAMLAKYAQACIEPQHLRSTKMKLPIVSISLVQGDALGGGFECALADDVIIAERSAKFGLPECLFSLFPGMGALSFLTRKVGAGLAEKMVFSGKIYTAVEMHEMGVVDVLVDDGMGEQAVYDFVEHNERSFTARRAVYAARQVISPITRVELDRIVDMWVDAALALGTTDLRIMERLAAAQDRRCASLNHALAAPSLVYE
jgi:DSF synthase